MRLIVVVGARPNFIKIGPLMPALKQAGLDASIAHTGQHYDASMSDVFFADLKLPRPTWFLGVGSGTHAVQTGSAMVALEQLFVQERPDFVLVVGDVNSTLAGALAAAKLGLPVVHLEAGLRSGDMSMPEEVNRLVTDQLSSLLLTTITGAKDVLLGEGCDSSRIRFVGNIMAESVLRHVSEASRRDPAKGLGVAGDYALVTVHRPENTDHPDRFAGIAAALKSLPVPVVLPAHPRTRPLLESVGLVGHPNVQVIDPVGYLDMLALQCDASVIVTDSGGIQEEACVLGTPCVTVRRNTERGVTIDLGANRLVPASAEKILEGVRSALDSPLGWELPERWDLNVSERVAQALAEGVVPLS